MKKFISIGLMCLLMAGLLVGCGKPFEADRDTIYIQKKGTVIGASISEFDKDYYDAAELQEYVEGRVQSYQAEHGEDSVQVDRFSVEEGIAKLYMKYESGGDYQELNEETLFAGTIPQALAEGFDFNAEFLGVEDGKLEGKTDNKTIVDLNAKVVVLSEKIDVKVDGTIQYVSWEGASIVAKDTVSLASEEEEEQAKKEEEDKTLVYIVYQ